MTDIAAPPARILRSVRLDRRQVAGIPPPADGGDSAGGSAPEQVVERPQEPEKEQDNDDRGISGGGDETPDQPVAELLRVVAAGDSDRAVGKHDKPGDVGKP